jgi:hypothetical protein
MGWTILVRQTEETCPAAKNRETGIEDKNYEKGLPIMTVPFH